MNFLMLPGASIRIIQMQNICKCFILLNAFSVPFQELPLDAVCILQETHNTHLVTQGEEAGPATCTLPGSWLGSIV